MSRSRLPVLAFSVIGAITACSTSSNGTVVLSVTEAPADPAAQEPGYDTFWAAVQHAAYDSLDGRTDLSEDESDFVTALRALEAGRFDDAESAFAALRARAEDAGLRGRAGGAHFWILVHQQRWKDLLQNGGEGDRAALALARAWVDAPKERVVFTAPSASVPTAVEHGAPFVEVSVGGRPYHFLLDTGASFTVVGSHVAKEAGLPYLGEAASAGTGTTRRVSATPSVAPELTVGTVLFQNHPCVVVDQRDLAARFLVFTRWQIDGVLGWNAIRNLDIEFDLRMPRTMVRQPTRRDVAERNLFWLGAPIVRTRLDDGLPLLAALDTGAAESHLTSSFFGVLPEGYRMHVAGTTRETTRRTWSAGGFERRPVQIAEGIAFVIGKQVVRFEPIRSGSSTHPELFSPLVVFGSDLAFHGRLRIDFLNGILELAP